jgi:hypothetical protein
VEVSRVKLGEFLQAFPIVNMQRASVQRDQAVSFQVPENPIDMDGGQAERITQFALRDRKRTSSFIIG